MVIVLRISEFDDYDPAPFAYNSGGVGRVKARAASNVSSAIIDELGGSDVYPLLYGEFADNGNMLQSEEISKRHYPCGDPRLGRPEDERKYSTPNAEWEVLSTFISGQIIEIDIVIVYYHWGHLEFAICDAADLDDPDGVVTQECFNMHPLTRAPDDGDASPIDPDYTGRYYVDPPCRADETEQNFNHFNLPDGPGESYSVKMRYVLPDIECSHCILRSYYFTGHRCYHIGYEKFNPPSWPSQCAPDKSDWVLIAPEWQTDMKQCGIDGAYPEEFWNCADIAITSVDEGTQPEDDDGASSFIDHGCFADTKTERIMEFMKLSDEQKNTMTNEVCMDICAQGGFKYSGTQYSNQCFCGGWDADHLQHGESANCHSPCSGDENEICGGSWCMSVRELL
ncbi:unnamed protein product [Ectocarpus fasciculatus]